MADWIKCEEVFEDRFKLLPMSILVSILSLLPVEHSAKTSVLSKYWKGLWLLSPRLDFHAPDLVRKLKASGLPESEWGSKYVEWVNKLLSAHKALHSDKDYVFEEFRFRFELDGHLYEQDVNAWLSYAFSLKVQSLELNLQVKDRHYSPSGDPFYSHYYFPKLLDPASDECSGGTSDCPNPVVLSEFRILRSLTLSGVRVSGEAIQFLLRKFPLLERLKVCDSQDLFYIQVCGLALKYLEITECKRLKCINVCDSCLVSLKVTGCFPKLVLENVPMLVDVLVSAYEIYLELLTRLSKAKNLKVLTLSLVYSHIKQDEANVIMFAELPELKELVVIVEKIGIFYSPSPMISLLLRAMPNLEKLVLKLEHVEEYPLRNNRLAYEDPSNLPLQHLKTLELHGGYHHLELECSLVNYFVRNAKALERIVLKPSDEDVLSSRIANPRPKMTPMAVAEKAKAQAERLREELPASVELVLL